MTFEIENKVEGAPKGPTHGDIRELAESLRQEQDNANDVRTFLGTGKKSGTVQGLLNEGWTNANFRELVTLVDDEEEDPEDGF